MILWYLLIYGVYTIYIIDTLPLCLLHMFVIALEMYIYINLFIILSTCFTAAGQDKYV